MLLQNILLDLTFKLKELALHRLEACSVYSTECEDVSALFREKP